MDLVRLAIPRRVYTQSHIDYVVEIILQVWERREQIKGMRLTYEAPFLRHFTAHLEPVGVKTDLTVIGGDAENQYCARTCGHCNETFVSQPADDVTFKAHAPTVAPKTAFTSTNALGATRMLFLLRFQHSANQ